MSAPVDFTLVVAAGRLMREGRTAREVGFELGVTWNVAQGLCRKARALMRKRTAPRTWAYELAKFDPVVARAIETWKALG